MSETPANLPVTEQPQAAPATKSSGPSMLHLGIVVGILAAGVLITALTADVTKTSEPGIVLVDNKPFLAAEFGDWKGSPLEGLSEVERNVLPADTQGARRVYTDSAGNHVYCSIVLAGRDVTSIHRPEVCLPGQGWKVESEYVEKVPVPIVAGGKLGIMRMNTIREVKQPDGAESRSYGLFAYWFVGKDRLTPHHWQRILWNTKDRVFHNTNHRWAYILIHAPVKPESGVDGVAKGNDAAMQLVARFVQELYPSLASPQG